MRGRRRDSGPVDGRAPASLPIEAQGIGGRGGVVRGESKKERDIEKGKFTCKIQYD